MFGIDLIVNESAFHAGEITKCELLTFVLLYSTYSLCSAFLVMSVWLEQKIDQTLGLINYFIRLD